MLGVAFICLLVAGVWFTHAIFSKKFVDYDRVTLQTSRIGLQLPARADVKVRGVIVGEVLDFEPTDEGAEITLGVHPERGRDDSRQRHRLDPAQDPVRREVRLPGDP